MSLSSFYPELACVDAVKSLLLASTGITDQIKNTRTNQSDIYDVPLNQMTVPCYPAISAFFVGVEYKQSNSIETGMVKIELDIMARNADKNTAMANAFKLSRDVKFILEQRRDLNNSAVIFNASSIVMAEISNSNSLWTAMCTLTLNVQTATHYFNPGIGYSG